MKSVFVDLHEMTPSGISIGRSDFIEAIVADDGKTFVRVSIEDAVPKNCIGYRVKLRSEGDWFEFLCT